jgi:hypothetical protein
VGAAAALAAATPAADRRALVRALDDPVRTRWHYVPLARPGVPLGAMSAAQRGAVASLVRSGLGDAGWARAEAIVAHERVLGALERERGVPGFERRDPARYHALLFGTPAAESAWGWRFEGHHLSVNATAVGDAPPVVAPLFMGASPARVPSGPRAGLRLFAAEEDSARALLLALPPALRRAATIADTTFGEIVTRNDPAVGALAPAGLAAAEMPERSGGSSARSCDCTRGAWPRRRRGAARPHRARRVRPGALRVGRRRRAGAAALLPHPRPHGAHRVRQQPEQRQPRAHRVARPGERLRARPAARALRAAPARPVTARAATACAPTARGARVTRARAR